MEAATGTASARGSATSNEGGGEPAADAKDALKDAAGQAKTTASDAADQAKEKIAGASEQARGRVREQVDQQTAKVGERANGTAGDLRNVSEQLRAQGNEQPAQLADQVADQVERLGGYLQGTDADGLLHDLEEFGRKRPWAVIAGGLAAGFIASRVLKASSDERYARGRSGAAPTAAAPTAASVPTAGAATPGGAPVGANEPFLEDALATPQTDVNRRREEGLGSDGAL